MFLVGFNGAENDGVCGVLHETTKQDKGRELTFRGFKSPPPMDVEDVEVSPLHMIFNLKGVLVGKEYLRINELLSPLFNLAWGPTLLLDKNVVPRPFIKEFFLGVLSSSLSIYGRLFHLPR
jgi:hypothetical protein